MLEGTEEQHRLLLEARQRPYVLDDDTVARMRRVFGAQARGPLAVRGAAQALEWRAADDRSAPRGGPSDPRAGQPVGSDKVGPGPGRRAQGPHDQSLLA